MVIYCLLLLVAAAAIFRNCSAYHEVVDCLERGDHWDNRTETCVPR